MLTEDREDSPETLKAKHLRELVQSEGWKLFLEHVEATWGADAQLQKIDAAHRELEPGNEAGERMTALQIRAAAKSIQRLVSWPAEKIGMNQAPARRTPFELFRRIAR